jgi:hypothetical protein
LTKKIGRLFIYPKTTSLPLRRRRRESSKKEEKFTVLETKGGTKWGPRECGSPINVK